MGSLILLVIVVLLNALGGRGMTNYGSVFNASGSTTDLQMQHDHEEVIKRQDKIWRRLLRSYLFWIALAGIIVSVIISKV